MDKKKVRANISRLTGLKGKKLDNAVNKFMRRSKGKSKKRGKKK